MAADLNLVVKVRRPTRVLTRPYEKSMMRAGTNPRVSLYEDCVLEPKAHAVMLTPSVDPGASTYGKAGYILQAGNPFTNQPDAWVEGKSPFGDDGGYVGFAGNETYSQSTPWAAYLTPTDPLTLVGENHAINFTLYWTPPTGTFFPRVEFFPRVDFTKWVSIGGYTYYFAPLGFFIDANNAMLTVTEYEYDNYEQFALNPTALLTPTYQHPLNTMTRGIAGVWVALRVIPVIEKYTSNDLPYESYYYHDFVIQSPMLEGGGFVYRTKIARKTLSLFPEGAPSIRSLVGGHCALNISPITFAAGGSVTGVKHSKREADAIYPTLTEKAYSPTGAAVSSHIVDVNGDRIFDDGTVFQDFWIKTEISPTDDQTETPILYSMEADLDGAAEDRAQDETDISDYVRISEQVSDDLIGYTADITLFNRDDSFNDLVYRALNEITFQLGGEDRAVLYTLDPGFEWWQTPTREALTITWRCGDFWERMKKLRIAGHPDYGGLSISSVITTYMTRIGFDPAKLHIATSLETIYLPRSRDKDNPLCKPEDGSTADEFIADMREKWFSTYPTYFDGTGDFWIDEPLDPQVEGNIHRTYYLSHDDADAAFIADGGAYDVGDLDEEPVSDDYTYFCREPKVTFLHSQYFNEIWVIGVDPATNEPIFARWFDELSQTGRNQDGSLNEGYQYYVGERRLLIVVTRLPNMSFVTRYGLELVKIFGYLRRQVSFNTKYDPTMRPGAYIQFYGISLVFQVTSTNVDIEGSNVSKSEDSTVHRCRIEATQYPLWPTA